MRVIVFFDLPVTTPEGRRAYTKFRKFLISDGFFMMQESVYCKIAPNQNGANALVEHVKRNAPLKGLVQLLTVTERQFANMEMIVGSSKSDVITSASRTVIL